MTRDILLQLLKDSKGREEGHYSADKALLEYINDPEITKAFNDIPDMWYA